MRRNVKERGMQSSPYINDCAREKFYLGKKKFIDNDGDDDSKTKEQICLLYQE